MHTAEPATSAYLAVSVRHIADNLIRMCEEDTCPPNQDYPLAPVFQVIAECLIATADRADAEDNNLRHECYETLNLVLDSTNPEKASLAWKATCNQVVTMYIIPTLLPRFGERLNTELGKPVVNADDNNTRTEWISHFCAVIQMCISSMVDTDGGPSAKQMLTTPDANQQTTADKFMILFLQVFQFQNTTAAAEVLLAVNQILNKLGPDFERYMQAFVPVLQGCLGAVQDVHLCRTAITTVSDLANGLKKQLLPYSDVIVQALLTVFGNPVVDSDIQHVHDFIKPVLCSAIGDLAREIGNGMEKYLAVFLQALQASTQISNALRQELSGQQGGVDEDKMEYLNAMIAGVLDGYTGILYGLKDAEDQGAQGAIDAFAQPDALQNGCLLMVTAVAEAAQNDLLLPGDEAVNKAIGIIGDIAKNFKGRTTAPSIKLLLQHGHVSQVLELGKKSDDDEQLRNLALWAGSMIHEL
jgi:hypothetical protein